MSKNFDEARAKLEEARWQYWMAENALARAITDLKEARREFDRLFQEHMPSAEETKP